MLCLFVKDQGTGYESDASDEVAPMEIAKTVFFSDTNVSELTVMFRDDPIGLRLIMDETYELFSNNGDQYSTFLAVVRDMNTYVYLQNVED